MVLRNASAVLALVLAVVVGGLVLTTPSTVARGADPETASGSTTSVSLQADTFTYDLGSPWTLLTWFGANGVSLEDALRAQGAAAGGENVFNVVTAVYAWEASGQRWLGFFPDAIDLPGVNDLDVLLNGEAYWVASSGGDGTWLIGTPTPPATASPTATGTPAATPSPDAPDESVALAYGAFCQTTPTCPQGPEPLLAGLAIFASFSFNAVPHDDVHAYLYVNGTAVNSWTWQEPFTSATGFYFPQGIGDVESAASIQMDVYVGTAYAGSIIGDIATPSPPLGGGGSGSEDLLCLPVSDSSYEWRMSVGLPLFSDDIFRITVAPLTDGAADDNFSYRVRVTKPGSVLGDYSSYQYSFYANQEVFINYPGIIDFLLVEPPFPTGFYSVELFLDFATLPEISLSVYCS